MGCCFTSSSAKVPNESSALLQNEQRYHRKSPNSITVRPKCKCGERMNAYELQCCYLSSNGDIFTGAINCDNCGVGLSDPHEVIWHCLKQHISTYNLCFECGTKLAVSSYKKLDREYKVEETKDDIPMMFDPKYNTENIDWNELWLIMCDEAKSMKIHKIITDELDLSKLSSYNLSDNIINFIHKICKQVENTHLVHNACVENIGWTIQTEQDDICISYKKEEGESFYSIKSNFLCECSVLDFIGTLNEFDLFGDLVKIVPVESRMLKEFTNSEKVIYMNVGIYWPLKNRDFIIHVGACGVYILQYIVNKR